MESTKETGCEAREGPILCINNCGFFGTAITMNMCSMCHKDVVLKQWQAKLAAASIENMVDGSSSNRMDTLPAHALNVEAAPIELKVESPIRMPDADAAAVSEPKAKKGPNRCSSCRKRVGLTGFSCRCGILFCSVHRYSDKHECQFDYRSAGQDAIARANPVVKADKLDKI